MATNGKLTISPEEVVSIAGRIENLNNQLDEILKGTQARMQGLQSSWTGEAASATMEAFNSFSGKYFENYKSLLQAYVTFLRSNVAQGYTGATTVVKSLADQIL